MWALIRNLFDFEREPHSEPLCSTGYWSLYLHTFIHGQYISVCSLPQISPLLCFLSWNIFTEGYYNFLQILFCETKKIYPPHGEWFVFFIPNGLPLHLLQFEWIFIANEWSELYEIFYAQLYQRTSFSLLKKLLFMCFSSTATFPHLSYIFMVQSFLH